MIFFAVLMPILLDYPLAHFLLALIHLFAAFVALLLALAPLAPLLFSPFLFITHNPILAYFLLEVKNKKT